MEGRLTRGDSDNMRVEYAIPDFLFRFQLYGTHWRKVEAGWQYPLHEHHFLEINLVLEGEQITKIGDKEWYQRAGDILYIPPWAKHSSRNSGQVPMTYMCLHLDMDDEVLYPLLAQTDCAVMEAGTELNANIRRCIDPYIHLHEQPLSTADKEAGIRLAGLQLTTLLVEWALAERNHNAAQREWITPRDPMQFREKSFMEQKVKALFADDVSSGSMPSVEAWLPNFRWIGVYTVHFSEGTFWDRTGRFSAKLSLEQILEALGTVVIVVREPVLNIVVFSNHFTVPPMEDYIGLCKSVLEQRFRIPVDVTLEGITTDIAEAAKLYRVSDRGIRNEQMGEVYSRDFIHRLIRDAIFLMEREYADPELSLAQLAARLEITPNYLSSLFKSQTGNTFSKHLTHIRMYHAKRLLRETNRKIYEIAESIGYTDYTYFSRVFSKTFSVSPHRYRTAALVSSSQKEDDIREQE